MLFEEEIKRLESMDIQTFVQNAMQAAPDSFKEDEELIKYTKKVFCITELLLDHDQVSGQIRDVILTGALLSDIARNEEEKYKDIHPLLVRPLLKDVKNDLVQPLWEGVIRIVESHEGANTPIEAIVPKPGSPEHLVSLANVIARSERVSISVE